MISNYMFSILFSLLFYVIGYIMTSFWKNEEHHESFKLAFLRMVLGILSVTTIFAVFKTGVDTILLGIVAVFILFLIFNKDKLLKRPNFTVKQTDLRTILIYTVILLVFNILFSAVIYPISYGVHPDYLFYGALSDYINLTNNENFYLSIYNPEELNKNFYHFFNEWCVALISSFSNTTGTYSLLYIFHPITYSILFIGLLQLVKSITRSSVLKSSALVSVFFIASSLSLGEGLPSIFKIGSFNLFYASFLSTPSSSKLVIVTILFLMLILFYKKSKEYNSIIILSIICFVWPSTVLGIVGGVGLFILYKLFYKKERVINEIFIILVTVVCFAIILLVQKNEVKVGIEKEASYLEHLQEFLSNGLNMKIFLKTFIETVGSRVYYYSIFILILILNFNRIRIYISKKSQYRDLFVLLILVMMTAFIARMLLFFISDSNQIFTNIFDNSFAKLAFFVILLLALKNKINYVFVALFACLSVVTMYYQYVQIQAKTIQSETLLKLENEFSRRNARFATILKVEESEFSHISQVVYPPLNEMRAFSPSYFPVNLSIIDRERMFENDLKQQSRYNGLKHNSAFYQYLQDKGIQNDDWAVKKQFLKDLRIEYLIVEDGSISEKELLELKIKSELPSYKKSIKIYKLEH